MRKSAIFLFSLIIFGILATASARELDQIIKAGKLRVAVTDTSSPPFFITPRGNNDYQGYELELIKSCAQAMGVKLELVPIESYAGIITALTEDKADIAMSQLSRTLQRILEVDFTQPYAKLHFALLVNRQAMLQMQKKESLDNYLRHYDGPLMVEKGSSDIAMAKVLFPKARLICFEKVSEVDELLKTRKLIAYFTNQIAIRSLMEKNTGSHVFYRRVILEDTSDNICIALQPNCPRLKFFLNCFLEEHANKINRNLKPVL